MSVPQISTEGRPSTSAATLVNSAMRNWPRQVRMRISVDLLGIPLMGALATFWMRPLERC